MSEPTAYLVGQIAGAFFITWALSRLAHKLRPGGLSRQWSAFAAFGFTLVVCLVVAGMTMGAMKAAISYIPPALFWLVLDLRKNRTVLEAESAEACLPKHVVNLGKSEGKESTIKAAAEQSSRVSRRIYEAFEGRRTRIGLVTLLMGLFLPLIALPFTQRYDPRFGFLYNLPKMKVVIIEGPRFDMYGLPQEDTNLPRVAMPYKYFFSLGGLLILVGSSIVVLYYRRE